MTNPVEPPEPPDNLYHLPTDPHADRWESAPPRAPRTDPAASHNTAAEQAILGTLLDHPHRINDVRTQLRPTDFYRPEHEDLYQLLLDRHDASQPIDHILIADHLITTGRINQPLWRNLGGPLYLQTLREADPVAANLDAHVERVRDHARIRSSLQAIEKARDTVRNASPDDLYDTLGQAMDGIEEALRRDGTPTSATTDTGLADLGWLLTGEAPEMPQPKYTHRGDDVALFYPAEINGLVGDPESGKTWVAMTAVVEALSNGETAAMIDVDHNGPNHTAARLLLLGARLEHLADPERFRYYEPHEPEQLLAAVDDNTRRHTDVVIVDSIGEVFPMLGVSTNDGDEMTTALRRVCTTMKTAGCCVITIDHLPKSTDARQTGFAIGTIAKKRMIRGTYLHVEARTQPAPGQIGRMTLRILKDAFGQVRKATPGGYAGTFVLDSTHSETAAITRWAIERESAPVDAATGTFRPTAYMERVSRHVEDNDQATFGDIKRAIGGKDTHLRTAIKLLIDEGFMTTIAGPRNSQLHHSISHYREAEDDHLNPTL